MRPGRQQQTERNISFACASAARQRRRLLACRTGCESTLPKIRQRHSRRADFWPAAMSEAISTCPKLRTRNRCVVCVREPRLCRVSGCNTLAKIEAWPISSAPDRKAAPERLDHKQDDPHAVRRLRHRAWPNFGQEMRPLQHALLRRRVPETTLGARWP